MQNIFLPLLELQYLGDKLQEEMKFKSGDSGFNTKCSEKYIERSIFHIINEHVMQPCEKHRSLYTNLRDANLSRPPAFQQVVLAENGSLEKKPAY